MRLLFPYFRMVDAIEMHNLDMRNILVILFLTVVSSLTAQNKIDFAGRTLPDDSTQTYNVIVEFADRNSDFGDDKFDVVSRLGAMAVVNATVSQIREIAELPQVVQVSVGQEVRPLDDTASQPTAMEVVKTCVDSLIPDKQSRIDDRGRMTNIIVNLCKRCKPQIRK